MFIVATNVIARPTGTPHARANKKRLSYSERKLVGEKNKKILD